MSIYLKSADDLEKIKVACSVWKKVREAIYATIKPGITFNELDFLAKKIILSHNCSCSFYLYNGFPKNICISVNEELIHGIPTDYKIKPNDLITFDIGVTYDDHYCDAAFTINMNPKNEDNEEILRITRKAMSNAINVANVGNHIGDIEYQIQQTVVNGKFNVIKDFGGHGCGNKLHEDPLIMCWGKPNTKQKIVKGMVFCIEPMVMTDSDEYIINDNKWTVIAKNKKLTCHEEHMIYIGDHGPEILTN